MEINLVNMGYDYTRLILACSLVIFVFAMLALKFGTKSFKDGDKPLKVQRR